MKRIKHGFLPILLTLLSFNFAWAEAPAGFYKTAEGKNQKEDLEVSVTPSKNLRANSEAKVKINLPQGDYAGKSVTIIARKTLN